MPSAADTHFGDLSWAVLHDCRSLAGVHDHVLQALFDAAELREFAEGDVLVRQGDPADGLFIMLAGRGRAILRGDEGDFVLGMFAPGDLIGEMALVTREPRTADVVADSPVTALLVPTPAFDEIAARHLELGVVLTQLVAERLGQGAHDGFGGKTVQGFRITHCVGRGGMSVVYQARSESTHDIVALKMMSYRLIYDAEALARFHQEANLLQSLEHPNIIKLKRLFPAYRTYFLEMEFCEGVDFDRYVRAVGPLPESQVRPMLGQLAQALEYIHARGLVHRDLKPANVMLTRTGEVKLTDFGLALPIITDADAQTRTTEHGVMGTPAFMAPEQLSGGPLDRRTDVYALGCVAYELLTGQHLFLATNVFQLVQEKLTLQLPPIEELGVSADLYDFIRRAVRVNPHERPDSVAPLVAWAGPCAAPPDALLNPGSTPTVSASTVTAPMTVPV